MHELGGRRGKGAGGVPLCAPCANKGATPLHFFHLPFSHVRGAEEGQKVEAQLPSSLHVLFLSHICKSFSCRSGSWGQKGGGMPVLCALRFDERMMAVEATCVGTIWDG